MTLRQLVFSDHAIISPYIYLQNFKESAWNLFKATKKACKMF